MKVIIPMSGIGKRFVDAGFKVPKPLIEVEGQPIIYHIIDLFPGETEFYFICNDFHLRTTTMKEVLLAKVPQAKIFSVSVEDRKGPVDAVLQIKEWIADNDEVIVSYCDYGTQWDYEEFIAEMREMNADGGIASYIGFHPHMLGGDNYAFMKHERMWVTDIQEKKPFTINKMAEYASNGTYYFRTGAILKTYFQKLMDAKMDLNGEYYVSLVYKLMIEAGLHVRIFEIEKMLQWGTPRDLEEYLVWSNYFKDRMREPMVFRGKENYTLLLPMAGAGSRFRIEGFDLPKPLLPVEEKEMVVQAVNCLPAAKANVFVCLNQHLADYPIKETLLGAFQNTTVIGIDGVTEGQACTCEIAVKELGLPDEEPLLISACDNGVYYNPADFYALMDDSSVDIIVWSFTNNATSKLYPHMYAWLSVDENNFINAVSIKKAFTDRVAKHCIIGTMWFRRTGLFMEGLKDIYSSNSRTNGEFYVDNVLVPLIEKGYKVKVFEVKNYLCWGTPNDYKTYLYWEEFFKVKFEY